MNRSTFFKTLGIGIAAAPTLAKVLAEEPKAEKLTFAKLKELRDMLEDLNSRNMQQKIAHHIATHNPYAGLQFGVDTKPMRFNA